MLKYCFIIFFVICSNLYLKAEDIGVKVGDVMSANKYFCKEVKEVDNIPCLFLNLVKICEKYECDNVSLNNSKLDFLNYYIPSIYKKCNIKYDFKDIDLEDISKFLSYSKKICNSLSGKLDLDYNNIDLKSYIYDNINNYNEIAFSIINIEFLKNGIVRIEFSRDSKSTPVSRLITITYKQIEKNQYKVNKYDYEDVAICDEADDC